VLSESLVGQAKTI